MAFTGFFMLSGSFLCSAQEQEPQASSLQNTLPSDSVPQSNAQVTDTTPDNPVFNPLSADAWMQRLIEQVQSSSFEMVYVVSANKRETLPYMWRRGTMPSGNVIEQLSLLNGPGFEQVVYQGKVSIFEPGYPPYSVQGSAVQSPIPQAFIHPGAGLKNAYDALLMGRNRIAGRMAQQIRVISKDKTRFGYHL
jgi:sigma-E factor negative regulatory protein RseB